MSSAVAHDTLSHPLAKDLGVSGDTFRKIQIGLTGQYATLCATGASKLRAVHGRLGYKSGDRILTGHMGLTERVSAKTPYVFVRYTDATGKVRREELGRFLLGMDTPVKHCNGAPLDFRIENPSLNAKRFQRRRGKTNRRRSLLLTA